MLSNEQRDERTVCVFLFFLTRFGSEMVPFGAPGVRGGGLIFDVFRGSRFVEGKSGIGGRVFLPRRVWIEETCSFRTAPGPSQEAFEATLFFIVVLDSRFCYEFLHETAKQLVFEGAPSGQMAFFVTYFSFRKGRFGDLFHLKRSTRAFSTKNEKKLEKQKDFR